MYKIIQSGSEGNAILYFNSILVDCGIPYSKIKPYLKDVQIVLLTHEHKDHLNLRTIKQLSFERPSLRFGCGDFLIDKLEGVRNVDVFDYGKIYNYGQFKVSPVKLYHDVPNFGYRIFKDNKKIFHATDTFTLEGITAKNYDLYALECNFDETRVYDIIREKEARGEFAHQRGSINSHLSLQKAQSFVLDNAGDNYEFIMLHQSKEF